MLFANDHLGQLGVPVDFLLGAVVVHGQAEGLRPLGLFDLPVAHRKRPDFDGAVQKIGEVRRRVDVRLRGLAQLGGHAPTLNRDLDSEANRPILETSRPDERGRAVEMRMRGVDCRIGPADQIAKNLVSNADRSVVAPDLPLVRTRTLNRKFFSRGVEGLQVVDIPGKFVQAIPPRRCPTHANHERLGTDIAKGRGDERFRGERDSEMRPGSQRSVPKTSSRRE